ncbi:MAG: alpha/beta fold hydrolase [Promethearchaeota archaeon]
MPSVKANNIKIEYETFGNPNSEPLLMILGNNAQLTYWDVDFCKQLADQGFWVIIFDNRDVGLSSKFEDFEPDLTKFFTDLQQGKEVEVPYTIFDMVDDAIGLMDALNIERAHIFGHSLGAFMTLCIATRYPSRVLSLVSFATGTGNPEIPLKTDLWEFFNNPIPEDRKALIKWRTSFRRKLNGETFPFDVKKTQTNVKKSYERSFSPTSSARHTMALNMGGNLKPLLKNVNIPTLVIQGTEDLIVPVEASEDVVNSIPGAELLLIEGMDHNMHPLVYNRIINRIVINAKRAR